jgi:RNA polymerase sigma-70 factor (ECF subfamily)
MEDSDEALMAKVGRGDAAACRTLVDRHLGRLVAFAARTLGDRGEAEDVAQDVFERVWKHAARWEPRAKVTTWLHRIALNLCLDRLDRRREGPLDDAPEPVDPAPSAADRLHSDDVGRHVHEALMTLPPKQRIAITLCHYQGLGQREAAEVMETSVEALESLLARGRRALKARLAAVAPSLLGDA